ncbi:MAG: acyltransferase [Actinomycetota bacterium]|nr:acyltransferase [Actinomycetota bacterium]
MIVADGGIVMRLWSGIRTDGRTGVRTSGRSVYLDALRAVALTRVVVYHASSNEWVTIFAAMPLMFFVAGSLFAASLERRRARLVIRDRYRRILIPYWLYLVAMVALWASLAVLNQISPLDWVGLLFPVLSADGPQGPGAGTPLELTWMALWYLQFHLILSLVGPLLRRAQQRHAVATWVTIGVLFGVGLLAGSAIAVVVFYFACWILGYHQHDGHLEQVLRRRWLPICAVVGPIGAALFVAVGPDPGTALGIRLGGLGAAMLGVFWLVAAMGLRPFVEPHLNGAATLTVVNWFSQRSLTIYMWHLVAIYVAVELALPGMSSWPVRVLWCAAGTVVAVVLFGWAEDFAARRKVRLWPRRVVTVPDRSTNR